MKINKTASLTRYLADVAKDVSQHAAAAAGLQQPKPIEIEIGEEGLIFWDPAKQAFTEPAGAPRKSWLMEALEEAAAAAPKEEPKEMNIRMHHTDIGSGYLTTEHGASSYGQPVFVADSGTAYGPGDKFPRFNCNTGYLHQVEGAEYTAEEIQWVHDYIVRTHLDGVRRHSDEGINSRNLVWMFGASWKTAEQLAEIERRNGERMVLNG